jgi:amino acid transporter
LGHVHAVYHTPDRSIWLFAAWSCTLVVGAATLTRFSLPVLSLGTTRLDFNLPPEKSLFDVLTDFAIFGAVLFETLALSAIFTFRRTLPHAERPYRCLGYPWVPILYIASMVVVALHMFAYQRTESMVGLAFMAVGAGVYVCWRFSGAHNVAKAASFGSQQTQS